jgi:TatD DNase family protein
MTEATAPCSLIDTHCHLDGSNAPDGADALIDRAREAGVRALVCVGVGGLDEAVHAVELAQRRADVVATVGVHPHDAETLDESLFDSLKALVRGERVVAVGEVGLDFHYDHSPRETQAQVFRRFIALARECSKPLVIHTRSAPKQTLDILREENARDVGGVIHCFSEDVEFAEQALNLGFDLSFSGIVTFKRAEAIQAVARWAPDDRIMVETDSPYLAPVPLRGKRCEPAYVAHTAQFVADLRAVPLEVLADQTTRNAQRLFGPALQPI